MIGKAFNYISQNVSVCFGSKADSQSIQFRKNIFYINIYIIKLKMTWYSQSEHTPYPPDVRGTLDEIVFEQSLYHYYLLLADE